MQVRKMKVFEVTLDVYNTLHTEVEAETADEAIEIAERLAYEDTWGCTAIFSHTKLVDVEQVHTLNEDIV